MIPVTHKLSQNQVLPIYIKYIFLFFISFIISHFLLADFWEGYNYIAHTIVELLGIIMLLFSFIDIWNSYESGSLYSNYLGLVLVIFIVLNLLHLACYAGLSTIPNSFSEPPMDSSLKYGVMISFFETFALTFLGLITPKNRINKWLGIFFAFLASAIFLLIMVKIVHLIPKFWKGQYVTVEKIRADTILSAAAVAVVLVYIKKLRAAADDCDSIIYRHIVLSMFSFIPARLCFVLGTEIESSMYFWGHLLKLSYYVIIYRGIYIATLEYPYKKVKEKKDYYEKLLNIFPIGIIVFDKKGKLNYVNKSCKELLGFDTEPIYGDNLEDFFENIRMDEVHKTILLKDLKNKGKCSTVFYGASASCPVEERKLVFIAMDFELGIMMTVRDAESIREIENLQLQTQTLLNSMEEAVCIIDNEMNIVMYNNKFPEVIDLDIDNIKGMKLSEVSKFVNIASDIGENSKEFGDKPMLGRIYTIQKKDYKRMELSVDCLPIYDKDSVRIGWIVESKDITEKKKAQENIIQKEKMALVGSMAASLVHEIKNPLASIKGLCQLMCLKADTGKIPEYAAVMENAVDDINKIVSDFLQFSRPGPGAYEKGSINELINSMEIMISTNGYKNGIVTYFSYSNIEKPVFINRRQIKNIILSLVDNAFEAMIGAVEPKLCISTKFDEAREEMRVSIKDNGMGMTEEQLSNIGTPFYTTKPKGTGLGISICNNIINEHRGNLIIESKFGEGSTFIIAIPCTND